MADLGRANNLRRAWGLIIIATIILAGGYLISYSSLESSELYLVHGFPSWRTTPVTSQGSSSVALFGNLTKPTLEPRGEILRLSSGLVMTNMSGSPGMKVKLVRERVNKSISGVLNPDINDPDINNPDINNPDINDPDINNPDINDPDINDPDINDPDINNPDINNPDINDPDINNPDINASARQPELFDNRKLDFTENHQTRTFWEPVNRSLVLEVTRTASESKSNHQVVLVGSTGSAVSGKPMPISQESEVDDTYGNGALGSPLNPLPFKGGNHCNNSNFKSWSKGIVTQLQPVIQKDCQGLFRGSKHEKDRVKKQRHHWKANQSVNEFVRRMSNCVLVHEEFLENFYVSQLEKDFPIAYILVVYTNAEQVVRLLKAIYRPQNVYCIHPDARKGKSFSRVFHTISQCLPNVFVASKLEKVYYAHHSIMDAQLNCMRDLLKYRQGRWEYVINLCGRELPLKTNRQMVSSLQSLKGYSAVGAHAINRFFLKQRFTHKYALNYHKGKMEELYKHLGRVPYKINIKKSMNFIAASRRFVHFLLSNKKAYAFRRFLRDVYAPEEHFYSSLYCLPEAPGARPPKNMSIKVPVIDTFRWIPDGWSKKSQLKYCKSGKVVHGICIVNYADLPIVLKLASISSDFFLNKYFMEWDHVVMDCMEEWLVKLNKQEYAQDCIRQ